MSNATSHLYAFMKIIRSFGMRLKDVALSKRPLLSRNGVDYEEVEDEKEGDILLGGYTPSNTDNEDGLLPGKFRPLRTRVLSSATRWTNRTSSTIVRLKPRALATLTVFLRFLIPSFIYLWRKDHDTKELHPTAYLDGLRGVAALFVMFHHYSCQFVPALLEGWGTEHDNYWLLQFPIIRITHNGTLMVQIFFVLSGFVLSVKGLRLARQGRQLEFVKSLASSAFRRWLRLALPVFGSLLVSLWITRMELWYILPLDWLGPWSVEKGHVAVSSGSSSIVDLLLASVTTANSSIGANMYGNYSAVHCWMGNSSLGDVANSSIGNSSFGNCNSSTVSLFPKPTERFVWFSSPAWMAPRLPSWWDQLVGFITATAHIVDPLIMNGIPLPGTPPSYDTGVLWTIPVEWTGSMIIFLVVLGVSWAKPWPKFLCISTLVCWGYYSNRGVMTQFISGLLLAEITLAKEGWCRERPYLPTASPYGTLRSPDTLMGRISISFVSVVGNSRKHAGTTFWTLIFLIGLFLGSFPYSKGDDSLGWATITSTLHAQNIPLNSTHFYFASSILIIASLNHCPTLQRLFTTRIAQYLGRISFSLYLLHMQGLWTVGTRVFPVCMRVVGGGEAQVRYTVGMVLGAVVVFPIQFWVSDVFCRAVDERSVRFARWVEGTLLVFGD